MNDLLRPEPTQRSVKHSGAWTNAGDAPARLQSLGRIHGRMEGIRAKVFGEFRVGFEQDERLIEIAIDEAETLAWQTGFPELVFPELAVEKARKAAASLAGRRYSLARSSPFITRL